MKTDIRNDYVVSNSFCCCCYSNDITDEKPSRIINILSNIRLYFKTIEIFGFVSVEA